MGCTSSHPPTEPEYARTKAYKSDTPDGHTSMAYKPRDTYANKKSKRRGGFFGPGLAAGAAGALSGGGGCGGGGGGGGCGGKSPCWLHNLH